MAYFGHILTAMVTPFDSKGYVDYESAASLAKYLVENGSDGIVVAGTTGESPTLTKQEKLELFKVVLATVGDKAKIIAGTGSNDTRASVEFTKEAEKLGVHGAMIVGPYYNKPTQEGYYQHFKAIAEATNLPLIIYNVPGRTASNILPSTIARLTEFKNIVAVKEATGNLDQASEIKRLAPKGFSIYSGDDSLTLPILAVGGAGIISVAAHIVGKEMQEMIQAFLSGNNAKATEIHLKLMPFFKAIFVTTNPIPIKTAVNMIGLKGGTFRLPMVEATQEEKDHLTRVMKELKILK